MGLGPHFLGNKGTRVPILRFHFHTTPAHLQQFCNLIWSDEGSVLECLILPEPPMDHSDCLIARNVSKVPEVPEMGASLSC